MASACAIKLRQLARFGGYTEARWKVRVRIEWDARKGARTCGNMMFLRLACRPRAARSWLHTQSTPTPFESSPLASQRGQRGNFMRKATPLASDELRSEYQRSDFGALVRGKYIRRLQTSSNVVVVDPEVADLFPNAAAVNAALRSLAGIAKRADSRRTRTG